MRPLKVCLILLGGVAVAAAQTTRPVVTYLTTADRTSLVARQPDPLQWHPAQDSAPPDIAINDNILLQPIEGFGFALTGGSAQLIHRMSPPARHQLLQELFGHAPGDAALSELRLSIGASDMNDHVFTYDDMPAGAQDNALRHFTLGEDEADIIPVLREILALAPTLRIIASPWSAPSWMKTNAAPKGGSLRPEFYPVYAEYLVRYIRGMAKHGIRVQAITVQNEPLNPKNTPSMLMQSSEQTAFIVNALGPALRRAHLATEILIWDHNCDHPEFPLAVLGDPQAARYVAGTAFHLYAGDVSAMTQVHDAFPDKKIEFTEQMVIEQTHTGRPPTPIADPVARIVIGVLRNWSRSVLLWNLAADPHFGPHTNDGGCPICQGALTLDGDRITRNIAFYTLAQIAPFVPPGSVRIDSTTDAATPNVAFRTPSGNVALVVTNAADAPHTVRVQWHGQVFESNLPPHAAATYLW